MNSTNLKLCFGILIFFTICSLSSFLCASIDGDEDLESIIDFRQYSPSLSDNNSDNSSDIGNNGSSESETTWPTQDLETESVEQIVLNQPNTVPLAQHLASLPIMVIIFYLRYFINLDSIFKWALNLFYFTFLAIFLQIYVGFCLSLNFDNCPFILQIERIDFSVDFNFGGRSVEISRWALVPFAWLTEIAIILVKYEFIIFPSISYFSSVSLLIFLFLAQLFYIYSFPLFSVQTA